MLRLPPTIAWQTEEENPCLCKTYFSAAKELNADKEETLALDLPNIHEEISYDRTAVRDIFQHVENCGMSRSLHQAWHH